MYPWPGWASYGPVPGESLWWIKVILVAGVALNIYLYGRLFVLPAIGRWWRRQPAKAVPTAPAPEGAPTVPAYNVWPESERAPASDATAVDADADERAYQLQWER
jgi:hypothetical protein